MTETTSDIISDDRVKLIHGHANFGPQMTMRSVVDDGVRKVHGGFHMGYTQQQILLGHGLVYKRRDKAPNKLSAKGHRYREALGREK